MLGGILETIGGAIMIAIPEPATTAAGSVMVADGMRRIAKSLD